MFTRPRRFGKSLNMSMLKCFFEPGGKKEIFDGLAISDEEELCEKYMGKFPVISVSLKGVNAGSFEGACRMAACMVNAEAMRMQYLLDSDRLTQHDKELFTKFLKPEIEEHILCDSLKILSGLLSRHYGRKVVLLIDEYDVPLAKALERGYYDQMVVFIRSFLEQALKTNYNLQFAVLTGCMRVSKESIFTGLNNLAVFSVTDVRFDEYFGFTDGEVKELMGYYGLSSGYRTVKDWYDGYEFGSVDVYCPWDVINYCALLRADHHAQPQNYWSNTSSNDAVRHFIQEADASTAKLEIERLIAGETITKTIRQELTYRDMYSSVDNIWSLLLTAGYLTKRGMPEGRLYPLAIPNMEIREIFTEQIMELFQENIRKNGEDASRFCDALQSGDAEAAERLLGGYLKKTISIRDTFVKKQLKENFYHGILIGLLGVRGNWAVFSNRESGEGYSDILIDVDQGELGIVVEVKYAGNGDLEEGCKKALEQIEKNRYDEALYDEGKDTVLKYGIACCKKRCRVQLLEG